MTSRSTSSSERKAEMEPAAPGAAARTLSGKLPGSRTSLPFAGPERVRREKTTARSRAFRSSRMLPGQEYEASMRREASQLRVGAAMDCAEGHEEMFGE